MEWSIEKKTLSAIVFAIRKAWNLGRTCADRVLFHLHRCRFTRTLLDCLEHIQNYMTNKQLEEQRKSLQHFIENHVIPFEHLTCFQWMWEDLRTNGISARGWTKLFRNTVFFLRILSVSLYLSIFCVIGSFYSFFCDQSVLFLLLFFTTIFVFLVTFLPFLYLHCSCYFDHFQYSSMWVKCLSWWYVDASRS